MHILEELIRSIAADERVKQLPMCSNTEPSLGGQCMQLAPLYHTALIASGVDQAYDFFDFAYQTLKAFDQWETVDDEVAAYIKDRASYNDSAYIGAILVSSDDVPGALAVLCAVLIHCLRCTASTTNAPVQTFAE